MLRFNQLFQGIKTLQRKKSFHFLSLLSSPLPLSFFLTPLFSDGFPLLQPNYVRKHTVRDGKTSSCHARNKERCFGRGGHSPSSSLSYPYLCSSICWFVAVVVALISRLSHFLFYHLHFPLFLIQAEGFLSRVMWNLRPKQTKMWMICFKCVLFSVFVISLINLCVAGVEK